MYHPLHANLFNIGLWWNESETKTNILSYSLVFQQVDFFIKYMNDIVSIYNKREFLRFSYFENNLNNPHSFTITKPIKPKQNLQFHCWMN